jgi:cell division protein FtsB
MAATAVLTGVALVQLGDSGVPAWRRLRTQDAQLAREVDELTSRNTELQQELKALREDPETLERLAREMAGMHGPGEEVMIVLPATEATTE